MMSSPGSVTAKTACMNAMFAPAVTMTEAAAADVNRVLRAQLRREPIDERREARTVLILVRRRLPERAADRLER